MGRECAVFVAILQGFSFLLPHCNEGGDYSKFGLKSSTIAASFGKAIMWPTSPRNKARGAAAGASVDASEEPFAGDRRPHRSVSLDSLHGFDATSESARSDRHGSSTVAAAVGAEGAATGGGLSSGDDGSRASPHHYAACDVSRALLIMLSNNIGQLAYLNAVRHRCAHVYFAGNFLRRDNAMAMRTLDYAIRFWSKGTMEGLFLRHEGYCGALGAFLSTLAGDDALGASSHGEPVTTV